jgi:glycosyltransferase involved in cell wall biosynthesis
MKSMKSSNQFIESGKEDCPLVTFALFAYNQEGYIREAVAGALAQEYTPLEIIISDDCSDDRTFNIIQEIKRSYEGPHRVVVRQTEKNCGTLLHVADVAKNARGELLVLAAGDDISKINRVTVLHEAWKRTGAWGLSSRFDRIDAEGTLLARDVKAAVIESHGFEKYFLPQDGAVRVVHGCTSAYDARVFNYLKLAPDDYILAEDGAISVLLNLIGREIVHLDKSLVLYRESQGSLTNNIGRRALSYSEVVRDERNIERFAGAQANRCRLFLRMNEQLRHAKVRGISLAGVEAELGQLEITRRWYEMPIMARALNIFYNRVPRGWALPRVLGRKPFYFAKWLASRLY